MKIPPYSFIIFSIYYSLNRARQKEIFGKKFQSSIKILKNIEKLICKITFRTRFLLIFINIFTECFIKLHALKMLKVLIKFLFSFFSNFCCKLYKRKPLKKWKVVPQNRFSSNSCVSLSSNIVYIFKSIL